MKKIIVFTIVTILSFGAFAQIKENDTTKIKWNSSTRIWIFHEKLKDKKDSSTEKHNYSKKDFVHWGGIDFGVCMFSTIDNKFILESESDISQVNNFLDLNYSKSLFFSLNAIEKNSRLYKNYLNLISGLGVEWNNYNFKRNITLDADAPYISKSNVIISPDSIKYFKNKLNITYLKLPLLIELNTNSENPKKSFHISAGFEFAYRINSSTKQKYEIDGYTIKSKRRDDYNLADFKYSSVVRIGYGNYFTLFGNYGLSQIFESNKGPAIFPFTAGISIDF
jgi:hypothetical protein